MSPANDGFGQGFGYLDEFVDYVVKELHAHELREGAMRARAGGWRGTAEVIPMEGEQRRRRSRSGG